MAKEKQSAKAQQAPAGNWKKRRKKILTFVVVAVVIVAVAAVVDYFVRHPQCEDETAALNIVIQKVLHTVDAIGPEDPFSMESLELTQIEGDRYYPVRLCRGEEDGSETEVALVYVREKDSLIFIKDETTNQLVPYGG